MFYIVICTSPQHLSVAAYIFHFIDENVSFIYYCALIWTDEQSRLWVEDHIQVIPKQEWQIFKFCYLKGDEWTKSPTGGWSNISHSQAGKTYLFLPIYGVTNEQNRLRVNDQIQVIPKQEGQIAKFSYLQGGWTTKVTYGWTVRYTSSLSGKIKYLSLPTYGVMNEQSCQRMDVQMQVILKQEWQITMSSYLRGGKMTKVTNRWTVIYKPFLSGNDK